MVELSRNADGVAEPARTLPLSGEYDVIVVGGGPAGIGAAIASAKAGCQTLLLERESSLGGLTTVGLVNIPLDFVSGIGHDMFTRLTAADGLWHRNSDPEKHKLVLDRMVKDAGCELLLVSYVVDSIVQQGHIRGVVIESKAGRQAVLAKRVIDCSGDADAAAFAGCEYAVGRPGDGYTQACSLEFRLGGVDWDKYVNSELKAADPKWIDLIEQARAEGDETWRIENHLNWMTHVPGRPEHEGVDEVSICFAHSRQCRPLDNRDLTRMYTEGREQADQLQRFIKQRVPGFERCWLIDTGTLLGVRDSRRVLGEYTLTGWDLAQWSHFDDVVSISGHGYDIHNPDGPGNLKWIPHEMNGQTRYVMATRAGVGSSWPPPGGYEALCDCHGNTGDEMQFPSPAYYDIPYRCLVPQGVDDLLVAGRCLSADFEAQSGCRLIMCCLTMGEAAGTAMALSLKQGIPPRKLAVKELQRTMVANGVNLGQKFREIPGLVNN